MDVSVVVPTYNRRQLLAQTLNSLRQQKAGAIRYEVIVVDNDSSDDTPTVVAQFREGWPDLKYAHEPRRGVSHARNTGIGAAQADIIAFTDDDVEPQPTWVASIKQAFDAHPEVDCIGGRINARWTTAPPSWLTTSFWGPIALQGPKGDSPYVDASCASRCLMTANFACRRSALLEVHGFSPDYLRDEDRELQLRLWRAGKRGIYIDSVVVTTEVPSERLTKRYHRQFYTRAAAAHARMRFLDSINAEGRLVPEMPDALKLFGSPGFVFRSFVHHLSRWALSVATLNWGQAFFHETRMLYFASYIWTRHRQEGPVWHALPRDCVRFARGVWGKRARTRRERSASGPLAQV
jgi:glycosyltransferase involved in cell wall biosynthesis